MPIQLGSPPFIARTFLEALVNSNKKLNVIIATSLFAVLFLLKASQQQDDEESFLFPPSEVAIIKILPLHCLACTLSCSCSCYYSRVRLMISHQPYQTSYSKQNKREDIIQL